MVVDEGVSVRNILDGDMAVMIAIDKRITGKDRTRSWPQKVSSHSKTYYPPLSFVAEKDGKVIGFIIGTIMGAEYALPLSGWINIIGVDPDFQGKGVGRLLMRAFILACHRRGIKCRLMVHEEDNRLRQMLESMGFKKGGLIDYVRGYEEM